MVVLRPGETPPTARTNRRSARHIPRPQRLPSRVLRVAARRHDRRSCCPANADLKVIDSVSVNVLPLADTELPVPFIVHWLLRQTAARR